MDKQVQLAMAKWPDVPDCYGWLALDARGNWRMRDQRCQELGLSGSKIGNLALRQFIARNYLADTDGRYFFQNGPQRVFVELEATPYIAQLDPVSGWRLHTGEVVDDCDAAWMTDAGGLILSWGNYLAQVDDRDMEQALTGLYSGQQPATDEQILAWLDQPVEGLTWHVKDRQLPVRSAQLTQLLRDRHIVASPQTSSR